jgi:hypothetical protein
MKLSLRQKLKKRGVDLAKEKLERAKGSVRAKVEHCFHVVKCLFKHRGTSNYQESRRRSGEDGGANSRSAINRASSRLLFRPNPPFSVIQTDFGR